MNRTIKFRAWNHHTKKMLYPSDVSMMPMDTSQHNHPTDSTGTTYLQWTGLLDKNGKEIYEGDTVKVRDCYEVVYFDRHIAAWVLGFPRPNLPQGYAPDEMLGQHSTRRIVYGNIYEHPNLLGDGA